jgi:hypothetical protein
MNDQIKALMGQTLDEKFSGTWSTMDMQDLTKFAERFAELIVQECINREELLGAIARGWCSEKNSHKTMDSDLALAIFNEVERQIKQHFSVEL